MKQYYCLITLLLFPIISLAEPPIDVKISATITIVDVIHHGKTVTIKRNQSPDNLIRKDYALISRKCPPFCIQPSTIAELELLDYLKRSASKEQKTLIIDSRTPDWVKKGTMPGAVNIPWTSLKLEAGAGPFEIADILENQFGAINIEGLWNFSDAKMLVLFCNGAWCG